VDVSKNELHRNAARTSLPGISEEEMTVYRATAQRVVVFGSLLRPECFNKWFDVDIAAWGIRQELAD
jgi:predicted nucleotidyltransferase